MRLQFTFAIGVMACLALAGRTCAQVNVFFQPEGTGDFFNEETSWLEPNLVFTTVPSWEFDEIALINTGGTATVSTNGDNFVTTQPVSNYEPFPGRLVLGSNPASTGTLEIQNGGVLRVKANTNTGLSAGNVNVGTTGVGTLRVLPGGTFTSEGPLTMGTSAANTIVVGDATGSGSATLSPNSATLSATTQVYSNANFNAATTLSFTNSSVYNVEVNGSGSGKVGATEVTQLDGTLHLNFTGVSPSLGSSWTVAEGGSITGSFDAITSSISLPFGQSFVLVNSTDGPGMQANVSLEEVLVLEVNRNSGAATITQPGATNISLDGYFIASDTVGSLNPGGWTSFASQGTQGTNWVATANDANTIGEVKATGSTSINGGGTAELGTIYNPFGGSFGEIGEDLQFFYTRPSDGAVVPAIVTYTGTAINSLILQVDPTSGETFLRNTSRTSVDIDNYYVQSASQSLSTAGWDSLDSQDFEGADTWLELLNTDGSLLGEVNVPGVTTIAPGAALSLGNAYVGDGSGTRDLDFEFLLFGDENPTQGMVIYEPYDSNVTLGDFNGDGQVNLADYTVWRDNLGSADESAINFSGDGGGVSTADYMVWKNSFGSSYAASSGLVVAGAAVPEPTAGCIGLLLSIALVAVRKQRT